MQTPTKTILFFFLRIVVIYTVLAIPWPGVKQGYHTVYCKVGNALFYRFGNSCRVTVSPLEKTGGGKDTELLLDIRHPEGRRGQAKLKIDAMYLGYKPTIFLIALVLSTPISWSRRGRSLAWGLLLVSGFVAFRVWLQLINNLSHPGPIQLYEFSGWFKAIIAGSARIFIMSPATSYFVPVFIWALVAIRFDDITHLFPATKKQSSSKAQT